MNNLYILVQAIIWKSDKPMSGYDIAMVVKGKTGNSHQQVYRELKKLATRDDVIVDVIPQVGKPDKKVYSFKSKEGFVTECGFVSDFSKTTVGYELLIRDVLDDTNNYDEYIKAMKECEIKFLNELNKAD